MKKKHNYEKRKTILVAFSGKNTIVIVKKMIKSKQQAIIANISSGFH